MMVISFSEVNIIDHLDFIMKTCETLKWTSHKYILNESINIPWVFSSLCSEIDGLIKDYNYMLPSINELLDQNMEESLELEEIKLTDTSYKEIKEKNIYPTVDHKLLRISLNCNKVLSILKNRATSTKESKKNLNELKEEIRKLEKEFPKNVLRDIYEAIDEFELNKKLGTVLICGRIISFYLNQVPGNINEKIIEMKSTNQLEMKGSSDWILKADKKTRDLFSHDLNYFPEPSETLSLLGDMVKVAKVINSYLKIKKII